MASFLIHRLKQPFAGLRNGIAVICMASLLGLLACDEAPAVQAPASRLDNVAPDTTGTASLAHFRKAIADRKAQGDTALMDKKRLLGILTDTIPGYLLEISLADTLETPLATLVEAKRVFYNDAEAIIELIAGDYVRDPGFMEVNLLRFNLAQGVEVEGVTDVKCDAPGLMPAGVPNSFCWSSFNKVQRVARIYIGVDFRYFITVEATMQDAPLDLARTASWLNWNSLGK